ncbi:Zn-ribbon domain-containing OB-fold protein [Yinghuangia sp. YIM S09857]|uniref:Zn-ribbon domain-containing OB-fold protein n=1 Tax=Yinghuangia sp. YIM S09857 TaxID=3436929 RepID=UPI003F53CF69
MHRPEPALTERTAEYWQSGADGVLRIARCGACGTYQHPPRPLCPRCHGADIAFAPVSGKGSVHSFTVNRHRWTPELDPPYVLAEVELPEQQGLRLMSAVVGCPVDAVHIGMPVTVHFEPAGRAFIPVFRP